MDQKLQAMIEELQGVCGKPAHEEVQKIQRCLPVPNDHVILWADMISYGGYPAGIALTDRAFISKAPKKDVKAANKEAKAKAKETGEKAHKLNAIYRIIPWDFFDPEDYDILERKDKGNRRYALKGKDETLAVFESKAMYEAFREYRSDAIRQRKEAEELAERSTISALNSFSVGGIMFNAAYDAGQTKTGHGIYAEEAGAKLDWIHGEKSTVVGRDNAKNGPDKIVGASPVQCKFCKTAYQTVEACFKKTPAGAKEFRYYDLNDNPMKIEVPKDQYADAVAYMKTRIEQGTVKGVNDPEAALDIIRKSNLSYQQVRNLAKPGTVESLVYDFAESSITCTSALGISAVCAFAQALWSTRSPKEAAKYAIVTGIRVYGLSFAGSVIASQLSRTSLMNAINPLATRITKRIGSKAAQEIVNAFRAMAGKKAIYGAAAQKSFAKFLGSNLITQGAMFVVFTVPDTYGLIEGRLSGAQYTKNITSLLVSFGSTIAGTAATGAIAGKKLTDKVGKKAVQVIGMSGGLLIGGIAGAATKAVGDIIREDDALWTTRMFNAIFVNMEIEYLLTAEEQDAVISQLDSDKKSLRKLQEKLVSSKEQEKEIRDYLQPLFEKAMRSRKRVTERDMKTLTENLVEILKEGDREIEV